MSRIATTPLIPITIASIYKKNSVPLPSRLALCTPDTKAASLAVTADLATLGFELRLSDMFRTHDMQEKAHDDYVNGKKPDFSPASGGSMHEAGRAIDIDLSSIGVKLKDFWEIAIAHGFFPIIKKPIPSLSESWHFDCRGSHGAVYDYGKSGKAGEIIPAYTMMAQSAINAIGVTLDKLPSQDVVFLQSSLIRLGFDPGRIDGVRGDRTNNALNDAGFDAGDPFGELSGLLRSKFRLSIRRSEVRA